MMQNRITPKQGLRDDRARKAFGRRSGRLSLSRKPWDWVDARPPGQEKRGIPVMEDRFGMNAGPSRTSSICMKSPDLERTQVLDAKKHCYCPSDENNSAFPLELFAGFGSYRFFAWSAFFISRLFSYMRSSARL